MTNQVNMNGWAFSAKNESYTKGNIFVKRWGRKAQAFLVTEVVYIAIATRDIQTPGNLVAFLGNLDRFNGASVELEDTEQQEEPLINA